MIEFMFNVIMVFLVFVLVLVLLVSLAFEYFK